MRSSLIVRSHYLLRTFFLSFLLILFSLDTLCALSFFERGFRAQQDALRAGFVKEYIKAGAFDLTVYRRFKNPGVSILNIPQSKMIRVYIEGDGRAYERRHILSDDPTPSDPVALRLATADRSDNVAYIARPGQFSAAGAPECPADYWSCRRFAPEVIDAFSAAIDELKRRSGAEYVELAGYSGGAAIAVLVASRRADIRSIRTVAGNLDSAALCSYHDVSALSGSLDPAECAGSVGSIPQRHFVGARDKVVPEGIARSFTSRAGFAGDSAITVVSDCSHNKGWAENWPRLIGIGLASPGKGAADG